jgi:hypothetical protein
MWQLSDFIRWYREPGTHDILKFKPLTGRPLNVSTSFTFPVLRFDLFAPHSQA